jgi:hypothetical protein
MRPLTLSGAFRKMPFSISKQYLAICGKSLFVARLTLEILWRSQHTLNMSREIRERCEMQEHVINMPGKTEEHVKWVPTRS